MCLRQAQISIFGAFDRLRYQFSVPSTGSGTGSSNKYKTVIEESRNHRDENKNVPSTSSGTESNTLIERSRNHRDENKNVPSTSSGTGSNTVAEPVEATQ